MQTAATKQPTLYGDVIGGVTTFFTMAYIVVVNPSILSTPGTGMPFTGAMTATVLIAFSMTLLMGLYARLPFAVAPGMGLNAFFAFTIVLQQQVPWQTALGMVFWAGVLFLLVSVTPLREAIAPAIPPGLRLAAAAGHRPAAHVDRVPQRRAHRSRPGDTAASGNARSPRRLPARGRAGGGDAAAPQQPAGLPRVDRAASPPAAWTLGYAMPPESVVSAPDFSSAFLKLDIMGALQLALLPAIVSILFTDLFDSLSTFIGVASASGLTEPDGRPLNLKRGLIVDSFATLGAGLAGTSSGTAYVESIAGIRMGARTGRASVVTALCFLPCLFVGPLAAAVPGYATAAVLVLVGLSMFQSVTTLDFTSIEDSLPAFVTIVLIPLTLSITQGILWGFLLHALLYAVVGRAREVRPIMWGLAVMSAGLLLIAR